MSIPVDSERGAGTPAGTPHGIGSTAEARAGAAWIGAAGALMCLLAVVVGALSRHLLARSLDRSMIEVIETGAHYQLVHGLAAIACVALLDRRPIRAFQLAGGLFLLGCVAFSGGLDAMALTGNRGFVAAVPIGGLTFMIGWVCVLVGFLRRP